MTQELQDKMRVIAEYMGMELYIPKNKAYKPYWKEYDKDGFIRAEHPYNKLKYLTSMDWLHPVAMKVLDKLSELCIKTEEYYRNLPISSDEAQEAREMDYIERRINSISISCRCKPINGEYIDLFNAVYDAIVFLNQTEKK